MPKLRFSRVGQSIADAGLQTFIEECRADSRRWFPRVADDFYHHVLSLTGEMGELANVVKKVMRGDFPFEQPDPKCDGLSMIESEIADIFIYLMDLCGAKEIDLARAYRIKREHNERRFGSGTENAYGETYEGVRGDQAESVGQGS